MFTHMKLNDSNKNQLIEFFAHYIAIHLPQNCVKNRKKKTAEGEFPTENSPRYDVQWNFIGFWFAGDENLLYFFNIFFRLTRIYSLTSVVIDWGWLKVQIISQEVNQPLQ